MIYSTTYVNTFCVSLCKYLHHWEQETLYTTSKIGQVLENNTTSIVTIFCGLQYFTTIHNNYFFSKSLSQNSFEMDEKLFKWKNFTIVFVNPWYMLYLIYNIVLCFKVQGLHPNGGINKLQIEPIFLVQHGLYSQTIPNMRLIYDDICRTKLDWFHTRGRRQLAGSTTWLLSFLGRLNCEF